jgi:hypothetical protein
MTATQGSAISVTQFVYDGDGARVLQVLPDGSRTAYVGNLLEAKWSAAGGLLFTDNFNDNQLSSAWTTLNGALSESNGVLSQTSSEYTDPRKALLSNSGIAFPNNHQITAKVRVDTWTDGSYARAGVGLLTDANGLGYNLVFHANHATVQFVKSEME